MKKLFIGLFVVFFSALAVANEVAVAPTVSPDGLPPLGESWVAENPYRGNPAAITIGQQAYNQACARCHGADASTNTAQAGAQMLFEILSLMAFSPAVKR